MYVSSYEFIKLTQIISIRIISKNIYVTTAIESNATKQEIEIAMRLKVKMVYRTVLLMATKNVKFIIDHTILFFSVL